MLPLQSLPILRKAKEVFGYVIRKLHLSRPASAGDNGTHIVTDLPGYDPLKAAQLSAYLLAKSGGSMSKLKLSKLLYLSERECVEGWGLPMFFDEYFSVKDGPICSHALDGVNGKADRAVWHRYVVAKDRRTVVLADAINVEEDLRQLSEADVEVANKILTKFGHMTPTEIRRWTHDFLPEYTEVAEKRIEITPEAMARGIGLASPEEFALAVAESRSQAADDPFA